MTDSQALSLGPRFASLLDADDFEGLRLLISERCVYETGDARLVGPEMILRSYRDASVAARSKFDRVLYESDIAESDGRSVLITFRDLLTVRDQHHVYSCQQRVRFGVGGQATRIEHFDLPGERDRLRAFCERLGVDLGR